MLFIYFLDSDPGLKIVRHFASKSALHPTGTRTRAFLWVCREQWRDCGSRREIDQTELLDPRSCPGGIEGVLTQTCGCDSASSSYARTFTSFRQQHLEGWLRRCWLKRVNICIGRQLVEMANLQMSDA